MNCRTTYMLVQKSTSTGVALGVLRGVHMLGVLEACLPELGP